MAFATYLRFEQLERDRYDRLVVKLDLDADPPSGQILHVAAPVDDGFEICEIWRTREAAIAYLESRFRPALIRVGAEPPTVRVVPLHNLFALDVDAIERIGSISLPAHVAPALVWPSRAGAGPSLHCRGPCSTRSPTSSRPPSATSGPASGWTRRRSRRRCARSASRCSRPTSTSRS